MICRGQDRPEKASKQRQTVETRNEVETLILLTPELVAEASAKTGQEKRLHTSRPIESARVLYAARGGKCSNPKRSEVTKSFPRLRFGLLLNLCTTLTAIGGVRSRFHRRA